MGRELGREPLAEEERSLSLLGGDVFMQEIPQNW